MSWKTKDTIKWKRVGPGHYELRAWYIWKEPEVFAEIKKQSSKWKYRLWSWGSNNPEPLEFSYETFNTARDIKKRVVELALSEEEEERDCG
jgi:hypothetical protein